MGSDFVHGFFHFLDFALEVMTMAYELDNQFRRLFYDAAIRVADWMVANQKAGDYDANKGRFAGAVSARELNTIWRSESWLTGVATMGMLMTWHRTEDKKYLDAALRAGEYLKTLQILDTREPRFFGAIREHTPQSTWCYPRDGLTGAMAMLWLYEETKEQEYLERVKMFNKWFMEHAMQKGWPAWQYYFSDRAPDFLQGSFHGGDAQYFFDYYRVTGDGTCLEKGVRSIVDYALEKFIMLDGRIKVIYNAEAKQYIEDGVTFKGMQKMHRHNDDFMTIGVLSAHLLYQEPRYLGRAEAYAHWLISEQRLDGGFGNPDVPPAAATVPNFLIDLYEVTKNPQYLQAALKGAKYLLTQQELNPEHKEIYGGFYGYDGKWNVGHHDVINLRTSGYALIALLKLEGKERGPYYSPFDRVGRFTARPIEP